MDKVYLQRTIRGLAVLYVELWPVPINYGVCQLINQVFVVFDDFNEIRFCSFEHWIDSTGLFEFIRCSIPVFVPQTDLIVKKVSAFDQIASSAL